MSEKMNYKVYVHIAPNGKRYYGITKRKVEVRWNNGKGYSNNDHFYKAINKYGWDNFDHIVIARGLTEEEAKWLEIELIREFDTTNRNKGYNITKGGEGTNGLKHSEETRKKLSEINKGKPLSEEHRKNISKSLKGHEVSEETKQKMSETKKGRIFTEEHKQKISETMKGKTLSEETKQKMSEAKKGRTLSEEHRKKLSENNPNATKVYCVELDMVFNTVTEASKFVGCSKMNISSVLRGRSKTAKGYHWIYAEDKDKLTS